MRKKGEDQVPGFAGPCWEDSAGGAAAGPGPLSVGRNGRMPRTNCSMVADLHQGTVARPMATERGGAMSSCGATLEVTREPLVITAPAPMLRVFFVGQINIAPGPIRTSGPMITWPEPRVLHRIMLRVEIIVLSMIVTRSGYSFSK